MRARSLSDQNIEFIKINRLLVSGSDMAKAFGVSKAVVNTYMRKHNLSADRETVIKFRSSAMHGKTTFSKAEDQFIKENYLLLPIKALGTQMGRSFQGIRGRLKRLGLVIPGEVLARNIAFGRIKKGAVSFNKGLKQCQFLSPEGIENSKVNWFKKGQQPPNAMANMDITLRTDKRNIQYQFIRISARKWVPLHRYLYEKSNGPIPTEMKLIFIDGNPMNCIITNLKLVTAAELMLLNSYHNYPIEIAQTIQLSGVLTRIINKRLKSLKDEK